MPGNDSVVSMVHLTFDWIDYSIFIIMLLVSFLIGTYFGFFSKQDNATEYLLGGKTMSYFPVAVSLTASHVSGITLLGIPTEVYSYGTQYAVIIFASIFTCIINVCIFIPVFYELQIASTFEYLEMRYAKSIRILCSLLFTITLFLYIPIVIYVPALAFAQATGWGIHVITPVISIVCIIYTSLGGLKAVVWTDTVQFLTTVGSLFVVLYLGINYLNGFSEIWRISAEGKRLVFFNMDPSPFIRSSFWSVAIGYTFIFTGHLGVYQGSIQKFLAVPTLSDAKKAMWATGFGMTVAKLISVFTGLIIYAKYHGCDPFTSKAIIRKDQILPYYVMDVADGIPGLPGLFLSGLMSASLSTMSINLNTLAGTIYQDFIAPFIPDHSRSESRAATIMKIIVVIVGVISVGFVFIVEHLGNVFHMSVSMGAVSGGPLLGMFVLGTLVPWSNVKGVMFGGTVSLAVMSWIIFGAEWYNAHGIIKHTPLPISTDQCPSAVNETILMEPTSPPLDPDNEPLFIYRLSFMYYYFLGTLITVVFGVIGSYVLGTVNLKDVNPRHIAPCMRRFLPRRDYKEVPLKELSIRDVKD
ncbi:sodium-coupled monocarboxylate transporter 1 [Cephus cinctus]|uniref:Sodium-coupled monocarboxylate transporter 1 n=1 Tax=Cephus cinctus TaxID=211228 RepID=A0AAJ7BVD8_CEPCN|nr:sodium-coupled monocarboxylate transporter 1 [Cephus cinctus]